jgi:hypothetical protein
MLVATSIAKGIQEQEIEPRATEKIGSKAEEERLPQEGNEKLQEWYVKQEEDSLDRLTAK